MLPRGLKSLLRQSHNRKSLPCRLPGLAACRTVRREPRAPPGRHSPCCPRPCDSRLPPYILSNRCFPPRLEPERPLLTACCPRRVAPHPKNRVAKSVGSGLGCCQGADKISTWLSILSEAKNTGALFVD